LSSSGSCEYFCLALLCDFVADALLNLSSSLSSAISSALVAALLILTTTTTTTTTTLTNDFYYCIHCYGIAIAL
jgi:hypothetical protein